MKTSTTVLRQFLLTGAFVSAAVAAFAQDIHFSQFGNSLLNLSPGLTGVFGGDARFAANYRDHYRSIPVPYLTFSGSAEYKIYLTKGDYTRFVTLGGQFNYDRQGSLHLTSIGAGMPVSLTLPVAKNNFLTAGILPYVGQRHFSTSSLSFDAQWVDCVYDPSAPYREDQLFQSARLKYFDLGAGLNYRLQGSHTRSKLDIGGAVHHINRPYHDFWSAELSNPGNVRLYRKISLYALGALQISENFDLIGMGLYRRQGGYREIAYGGGLRFHLDRRLYREFALQVGANYRQRYGDALVPQIEAHWKTWTLGFTYDFNFNQINQLTDRRGGPELSLVYRLFRLKPTIFKSCPMI